MASESEESISIKAQSASWEGSGSNDPGSFECNICFELAQEPIVTLCGHLFCWPCLYKWLHIHSNSQECPVCKAIVEEQKLVPLYGRGKTPTDPRSKSIPGVNIPKRPAGQRPETASPPNTSFFSQDEFGTMGGRAPMETTRFGSLTLSAAFGGFFPSLFNIQVHGSPHAAFYGTAAGFSHGVSNSFHRRQSHWFPQPANQMPNGDLFLKRSFLVIAVLVILVLVFS